MNENLRKNLHSLYDLSVYHKSFLIVKRKWKFHICVDQLNELGRKEKQLILNHTK